MKILYAYILPGVLSGLLYMNTILVSYAAVMVPPPTSNLIIKGSEVVTGTPQGLEIFIVPLITWLMGLASVISIMVITWAGIQMILAIGGEDQFKRSRRAIIYAFVGLIISLSAFGIIKMVTELDLSDILL